MQAVDEDIKSSQQGYTSKLYTVCFVCTANMCRSAMAQGLLQARLTSAGLSDKVRVVGGGTRAAHGYPATEEAVNELRDRGLDITGHRSRPADGELLQASDLVLTATADQARELRFEFEALAPRIHTLRGYGRPPDWKGIENVDDPVGRGPEAYRLTADLLEEQLDRLWPLLMRAAGLGPAPSGPGREEVA